MYNGYGMNYTPYQNGAMSDVLSQYKTPYQYAPPFQNQMMTQKPQIGGGFIWVQGEEGAKAYLVAPDTTVTLWDSENPIIYIKSADRNGIPSMRVLEFKEKASKSQESSQVLQGNKNGADYLTRNEFDEFRSKFEELEGYVKSLKENKEENTNG